MDWLDLLDDWWQLRRVGREPSPAYTALLAVLAAGLGVHSLATGETVRGVAWVVCGAALARFAGWGDSTGWVDHVLGVVALGALGVALATYWL